MKKRKRLCLLVIALLFTSSVVQVSAATLRSSLYLLRYSAFVQQEGDGRVSVWFDVMGTDVMDEIGTTKIVLQESTTGKGSWITVKQYDSASYPEMLGSGKKNHMSSVSYDGVANRYYKAVVTVYAEKDGAGDSRTINTAIERAK